MNEKQKRTIHYSFKATPEEDAVIRKKMEVAGIKNQSAFIRLMTLNGYLLNPRYEHAGRRYKRHGKAENTRHDFKQ